MDFEDSSEEIEDESMGRTPEGLDSEASEEELGDIEEDLGDIEKDRHSSRHSLEVRRAIEDHLERTRLRKELDYLYDDDFANDNEEEKE